VQRLRSEKAPLSEWRHEALARYAQGRHDEVRQILEAAAVESAKVETLAPGSERSANLHLLAVHHLATLLSPPRPATGHVESTLAKVAQLLDQAEAIDVSLGAGSGLEAFVARGFHALAKHVLLSPKGGEELKRAEILFDMALKLDSNSPRALLGKAIVLVQYKEWTKALGGFRQVLRRAAPGAPRGGLRLRSLKQLRFAMAVCFCGLNRYEQTRNALSGVVAGEAEDVESLCALAHLELKIAKDGVGKSMEYLDEAVKQDQAHPVVLCQVANHAFYCGLEEGNESGANGGPAPLEMAEECLNKAFAITQSSQVRAEAHYQMGRLRHKQGQFEAAQEHYEKCCRLQPEHFAAFYGLAQTCIHMQKVGEAITALEKIRKARGDIPEVLKLLTFAYLKAGDKAAEAARCAEALVSKDKEDMEAWAMRAEAQDQLAVLQPSPTAHKDGMEAYENMAKLLDSDTNSRHDNPQMWNNLGTLRGLSGDPDGAKEAYRHGIELAEHRLADASAEEAKDLQVARLTMKFNKAWLSESSGDQPDFAQATQDYMAINEEHNWYVDTLLRLGAQWQRLGEADIAVQRYADAMKQNPVLGALMQAEVYRHQGDYKKAIQSAESASQCAGEKQFHYVHVYLGNLYFEVACSGSTKQRERDGYLCKALRHYTKALANKKDSHYAANGIGMVFAQRGKLDFARRTFQSVVQHHGMAADPAVYINLAHTYLRAGGDDARKAIALYERAKKLRPDDLTIRLYLAKAHFTLREYEKAVGVLSDATQIWPDDLLLRYNLALALESFGVYLVSMEKKTKRVVGVDSGMEQMARAVRLLGSAGKLYQFVHSQWSTLPEDKRKDLAKASGAPQNLTEEMHRAYLHREYCEDIRQKAEEQLGELQFRRCAMDDRISRINEGEERRKRAEQLEEAAEKQRRADERIEDEEQAERTYKKGLNEIELGKDLEHFVQSKNQPLKANRGKKGFPQPSSQQSHEQVAALGTPAEGEYEEGPYQSKKEKKKKKDKKRSRSPGADGGARKRKSKWGPDTGGFSMTAIPAGRGGAAAPSVEETMPKFTDEEMVKQTIVLENLSLSVTGQELIEFFNGAVLAVTANAVQQASNKNVAPVFACTVTEEERGTEKRKTAELKFRTTDGASVGMKLNGIEYKGHKVIIKRPDDYEVPEDGDPSGKINLHEMSLARLVGADAAAGRSQNLGPAPKLSIFNLPEAMNESIVRDLLSQFGKLRMLSLIRDLGTGKIKGYGILEYDNPNDVDLAIIALNGFVCGQNVIRVQKLGGQAETAKPKEAPVAATAMSNSMTQKIVSNPVLAMQVKQGREVGSRPSTVVQLLNAVYQEDLMDDQDYEDITAEVHSEASKHGTVVRVVIPKPAKDGNYIDGVGKIFVAFSDLTAARKFQMDANGRKFENRVVCAAFYPLEKFNDGKYKLWST